MSRFNLLSDLSPKSFLPRGGRIVKWKGGTASMIPQIAELRLTASAATIGAVLIFGLGISTAPAMAGTCTETAPGSGEFICADPAGADVTQTLAGAPVTVTTQAGFGLTTAAGDGFVIGGVSGASFVDAGASAITGLQNGVNISNAGTNSLSFTSNGAINGLFDNGINAVNAAGTIDLTINSDLVSGGANGINAFNNGTGALRVSSTGTATGAEYAGINASNSGNGTNLAVNAADTSGNTNGILVSNNGTGALTISSTGMATGADGDGIYAFNSANGANLAINAVDTSGGQNGIEAINLGAGAVSVNSTGAASGTNDDGIFAYNSVNGTDLTVTAVDSNGGVNGIDVDTNGSGALTIASTGTAMGTSADGIDASNSTNGTDLTINAVDTNGGDHGINAINNGSGTLTISSTGTASGTLYDGINAFNDATGTDLTINAVDISGGQYGIDARNNGSGAMMISSTGTASGALFDGIDAFSSGTDLTVDALHTSGGLNGIDARDQGSGALTVISTGTATGVLYNGIEANNSANGTGALTINALDTNGGYNGIEARNNGSGALRIISTGTATGTDFDGIDAFNSGNSTGLTINAVDTDGGENGIGASNFGAGALTISSTGTANGTYYAGIAGFNSANGTNLTVSAADSNGGNYGIFAHNSGTGALSIESTGTAAGIDSDGIEAANFINGTDVTVNAVDTSGGLNGIDTRNQGNGALTITSTGTATGTVSDGIGAYNSGNGIDLTITSNVATGNNNGIYGFNNGTGALRIASTGAATGANLNGIDGLNAGTDLAINAVDTSGGRNGIDANNQGTGGLLITSAGMARGTDYYGIQAFNSAGGSALIIDAVDSNGGETGIRALNIGTGALTVSSTGTASGILDDGIDAINSGNGTNLLINAGNSSGGEIGINATNSGTGALTIISTGTATGTNISGINASNGGTALTINAVDASGGYHGIGVGNFGSGALTVTSTGMTTGTLGVGIFAYNDATGTNVTVNAVDTSGGQRSIVAINNGSGAVEVTSTGTAIGSLYDGVYAFNSGNGTDLTVDAVDTSGGQYGIEASNIGYGALTITSTGTANGMSFDGIDAYNSVNGTDLTIIAVDTSGEINGIDAANEGSGTLRISSAGTASGADHHGIQAYNSVNGTGLTVSAFDSSGGENGIDATNFGSGVLAIISTGTATGGNDGIYALHEGMEPAVITTSGTVLGGTGNAITAITTGASITVTNSGTLESSAGFALAASGGVTELTNSGTINGALQLSMFDDAVINSGQFNATMDSDFGAGNDLFTNDGTVAVEGAIALNGLEQLVNNDVISMTNGAVGDSLTVPGDYVGGGSLGIDVSFDGAGSSDILVVSGSARGSTSLVINDISTVPNFGNMVLIVDAGAGTVADAFSLSAESVTIGFVSYSVSFDAAGNDFFLSSAIGAPVFQTLKFVEGAQSLWHRSTDAWTAHMTSPKDRSASPMWMQIDSSANGEEDSFDFTSGGFAQNINLDYEQDYFGFQLGYEFGPGVTSEGVLVGFTSGYLTSNLGFDAMADNVRYDAFNIGAYAGFKSEGFFANALAKYDIIDADVTARTAGYTADLNGEAYGVRLEAGYRWGDEGFFVQPIASIEYQQTSLDDFSTLGANIDFDTFDSLHAVAGVRLGGEREINISNALTYYLSGKAVHQSQSDDGLLFTSGISSIQIQNRLSNTFGRFELGVNIVSQGGVSGFIEGNADMSGDYTGYRGRAGLKIPF